MVSSFVRAIEQGTVVLDYSRVYIRCPSTPRSSGGPRDNPVAGGHGLRKRRKNKQQENAAKLEQPDNQHYPPTPPPSPFLARSKRGLWGQFVVQRLSIDPATHQLWRSHRFTFTTKQTYRVRHDRNDPGRYRSARRH